ncbi:hypothetical protein K7432_003048 [Basidiobolus ranarum]|uniref:Peptidase C51 domain-containing protein n=1 Tax=Basidiobolus ranarum TaxID=34480 RepID=A0ABR2X0K1_9FUNG
MYTLTPFLILSIWLHSFIVQPLPLYNTNVQNMNRSDSGMLVLPNAYLPSSIQTKLSRRNRNSTGNRYQGNQSGGSPNNNNSNNGNTRSTGYKSNDRVNGNNNNQSSNSKGNSSGAIGTLQFRFNNGQCTDWADARYAQLTGHHVDWSGDALSWPSSARNSAGWTVSSQAKSPSIIALQPGVQGVGSDGHVAVVESIESNGDVYTSNYNYNGGPYIKTFVTFKPGNGVSFIWHN